MMQHQASSSVHSKLHDMSPHLLLLQRDCLNAMLPRDERGRRGEDSDTARDRERGDVSMFIEKILREVNQMKSNTKNLLPIARTAIGVLFASAMGLSAAQTPAASDKVVARLGNVTIGQSEITSLLQGMPEAERAAIKGNRTGVENWLRQRLTSEALLNEAKAKGWAARPEVKARIDAAVREVTNRMISSSYLESIAQVPATYPSDAEVKSAYEQGKANFNLPATYRVAQIYLANTGTDAAATTKLREEAKKLAVQARQGDFSALARTRSQDPRSAERGGEVGMLPLDQMLPEVRDAIAKLKVGQVSEPVQSATGFHIVKLLETQPARTATLEEIKPRLQTALREKRQQQLVQAHLAGLAPAASLNIDNAALDAALK